MTDIESAEVSTTFISASDNSYRQSLGNSIIQATPESGERLWMIKRILIGIVGIILGAVTYLPNAMMATQEKFLLPARIGIAASWLFFGAGIYGAKVGENVWMTIPIALQALALLWFDAISVQGA